MTKVTEIEIKPSTLELQEGSYGLVEAYLEPSSATYADIVWTTDNSNIATVNSGHIVAKKRGTTKVKAVSLCDVSVKGECTLTVIPPKRVQGIYFPKAEYTMTLGIPDYIFPNFTPSDALNKDLTWCGYDENIISVCDGLVTPKSAGTTTLIAVSSDGSRTASCTVRVVMENVTIKESNGLVDIFLHSSNRTWQCICADMIFDDQNRTNLLYINRSNNNLYKNLQENNKVFNTYTPEEINLIYRVDPLGFAYYVQTYASLTRTGNLSGQIDFKDDIFRIIFNREPQYYRRKNLQEWEVTTKSGNPSTYISESEIIFGVHPIYDQYSIAQLKALAVDLFCFVVGTALALSQLNVPIGFNIAMSSIANIAKNFILNSVNLETTNIFDAVIPSQALNAFEDTDLSPIGDIVSAYGDLFSILTTTINSSVNFNSHVIDYCDQNIPIEANLILLNGESITLHEINKELKNMS